MVFLYPIIMKREDIPFKIGMQYENWEFNLDILPDRIKGFDSYIYIGIEFIQYLNYKPDESELLFNCDILEGVILTFRDRTSNFHKDLKETVFPNVDSLEELDIKYLSECECNSNCLALCVFNKDKDVYLVYGKKYIFLSILRKLL